jgi:excisionase family DNA binding protein
MVVWIEEEAYLTARETCDLLGVKTQTLYAYVSRGLLRSFRQGIRRQRLYLRREVDALRQLGPTRDRRRPSEQSRPRGRILRAKVIPRAEDWIGHS